MTWLEETAAADTQRRGAVLQCRQATRPSRVRLFAGNFLPKAKGSARGSRDGAEVGRRGKMQGVRLSASDEGDR
jgi:hypothetical protein